MKKQVRTIEQLKDSRLMFEKQLPNFGYVLLLIITVSLIGGECGACTLTNPT